MNNKLSLKVLDRDHVLYSKDDLSFWLSTQKYELFKNEHNFNDRGPIYVKVSCNEPLKIFSIFGKLETINSNSKLSSKYDLYISKNVFSQDILVDDNTTVEISNLEVDSLATAISISIKLDEEEVLTWSEDEANIAENVFKSQNKIVSNNQVCVVKTGTKKAVFGKITKIYPDNHKNIAYQINEDTKVVLLGLSDDKQKVIDFSKIGGLDSIIRSLREIIQIPLLYPHLLNKFNIIPPRGLILHGPPGNGKTMIAKAIAYSLGSKFISIEGPELTSKYVGEGERRLRDKFEEAYAAKNSVIFIDEIDSIAASREKTDAEHNIAMVSTLLNLMDGIRSDSNIFVIGATNRLNALDEAFRRPGRFELEDEVPIPSKPARLDILNKTIDIAERKALEDEIDTSFIHDLSEITNGYSGADLVSLYRQSSMNAIRRFLKFDEKTGKVKLIDSEDKIKLNKSDFLSTIKKITPTSIRSYDILKKNIPWEDIFGLKTQKQELITIHNILHSKNKTVYSNRFSLSNVILWGKKGSGKSTLISAFADKYNYDIIFIDFLLFSNLNIRQISEKIIKTLKNCKQIAPSIIYFKNLFFLVDYQLLLLLIFSELAKISNRYIVLVFIEVEDNSKINRLTGYKKFNKVIDFNNYEKEETINEIIQKFDIDESKVNDLVNKKVLPIGQLISYCEEQKLISNK